MNRKEDYATKADIARLEAKSATKDDIAKIDASTKRLALEIGRTNARMDSFGQRVTRAVADNSDRILTALDRYSKVVEGAVRNAGSARRTGPTSWARP